MNDQQHRDYEERLEVDFSFEIQGLACCLPAAARSGSRLSRGSLWIPDW